MTAMTSIGRRTRWLAALSLAMISTGARAQEPADEAPADEAPAAPETTATDAPPDCGKTDRNTPPDPRCGDSLDGREAALPPGSEAGKAALYVPKEVALGAVWPLWKGADFVERNNIANWYRA